MYKRGDHNGTAPPLRKQLIRMVFLCFIVVPYHVAVMLKNVFIAPYHLAKHPCVLFQHRFIRGYVKDPPVTEFFTELHGCFHRRHRFSAAGRYEQSVYAPFAIGIRNTFLRKRRSHLVYGSLRRTCRECAAVIVYISAQEFPVRLNVVPFRLCTEAKCVKSVGVYERAFHIANRQPYRKHDLLRRLFFIRDLPEKLLLQPLIKCVKLFSGVVKQPVNIAVARQHASEKFVLCFIITHIALRSDFRDSNIRSVCSHNIAKTRVMSANGKSGHLTEQSVAPSFSARLILPSIPCADGRMVQLCFSFRGAKIVLPRLPRFAHVVEQPHKIPRFPQSYCGTCVSSHLCNL